MRDVELFAMQHASQVRKSRRSVGTLNTNFIQLASAEQWTELCELDHAEACVDDFDTVRRLPLVARRLSRIVNLRIVSLKWRVCRRMDSPPSTWRRIMARSTSSTNWSGEAPVSMRSPIM